MLSAHLVQSPVLACHLALPASALRAAEDAPMEPSTAGECSPEGHEGVSAGARGAGQCCCWGGPRRKHPGSPSLLVTTTRQQTRPPLCSRQVSMKVSPGMRHLPEALRPRPPPAGPQATHSGQLCSSCSVLY